MINRNSHTNNKAYGFDARASPEALGLGAQIYVSTWTCTASALFLESKSLDDGRNFGEGILI